MDTIGKIEAALIQAYVGMALGLPTSYPLKEFTPPADTPWAQVASVPADKTVRTLGDGGQDNVSGYFQIDFFVPENDGRTRMNGFIDATLRQFRNGRVFTYGGQEVKVRRSTLSPAGKAPSASYAKSVTIFWDSSSQR